MQLNIKSRLRRYLPSCRTIFYHFLNCFGVAYTMFIEFGTLVITVIYTCPGLYGPEQCKSVNLKSYFLVAEVFTNILLFHWYKNYNAPFYWFVFRFVDLCFQTNKFLECLIWHLRFADWRGHKCFLLTLFPTKTALAICRYGEQMRVKKTGRYCELCLDQVPLRSHHCPLCNLCILRRDHHCFTVGACVGFANQRFFIVYLFWCVVAALYGPFI